MKEEGAKGAEVSESVLRAILSNQCLHECDSQILNVDDYRGCALFYDIDAHQENISFLKRSFESKLDESEKAKFFHALAIKSNPLQWFMKNYISHDTIGAECASWGEVTNALLSGLTPQKIIFDSPCKSYAELSQSLELGVHLNMDNIQELERVETLLGGRKPKGVVGIRINPLVGAGSVAALSVSTGKSKFGTPLEDQGENREMLVAKLVESEFITCIHVHTGSGGMGMKQLVLGARKAVDLALEVNKRRKGSKIDIIDIGGGLPVSYESREQTPTFASYADALAASVPELFQKGLFKRVITEFGAAINCKFGFFASRVEYTKQYDGNNICLVHGGSDIFLRAAYCPGKFYNYRVKVFDSGGNLKSGEVESYDIAGPLCFAGDIVLRDVKLPHLEPNDIVVIEDAGGNTLSLKNMHCSRSLPAVFGYKRISGGGFDIIEIKKQQSSKDTINMWSS